MSEAPISHGDIELVSSMVELVKTMATSLVDSPDQVIVDAMTEGQSTTIILHVAPADLGKVIGKQGRTARSMRTILGAASMRGQHRFALDILQAGPADEPSPSQN